VRHGGTKTLGHSADPGAVTHRRTMEHDLQPLHMQLCAQSGSNQLSPAMPDVPRNNIALDPT